MQLAFLDESTTSTSFYITALCVDDSDAIPLAAALDDVVRWAMTTYGGIHLKTCLHGVDLIGGKREWAAWREPAKMPQRYEVYKAAINVIAAFDVRIWIRGAHLKVFASRYATTDVHGTVLPWVLERVQQDATEQNDVALVIADQLQRQEFYRDRAGFYFRHGTNGWKPTQLDRLADTLHFAPSGSSRLLQATDLVSYVHTQIGRSHKHQQQHDDWWGMWKVLYPRVREMSLWQG